MSLDVYYLRCSVAKTNACGSARTEMPSCIPHSLLVELGSIHKSRQLCTLHFAQFFGIPFFRIEQIKSRRGFLGTHWRTSSTRTILNTSALVPRLYPCYWRNPLRHQPVLLLLPFSKSFITMYLILPAAVSTAELLCLPASQLAYSPIPGRRTKRYPYQLYTYYCNVVHTIQTLSGPLAAELVILCNAL
jgi:hypothetical protein